MAERKRTGRMLRVYRLNTGSCGGCDLEMIAAVTAATDIVWAVDPFDADLLLLTGTLTPSVRPAVNALVQELGERTPILAVGRCAIDGHPFGRGGLAETPSIKARLTLDGCPPSPDQIVAAIRATLEQVEG